jgi:ubiquinone/menaquinone biosynthesis C-methylase UbiE
MNHFDERAKQWDSDPAKVERAQIVANVIRSKKLIKAGMSALEYGCGTGLLSFALQQDFASITLADNSPGMLEVLTEKIKSSGVGNMHPLLVSADFQPASAAHFDIIYSLLTLHHLPETNDALKYFGTLLNPGGFLCIADLEKEDGSFHGPTITDVHLGFDRSTLQLQAEIAGFMDVQYTPAFDVRKLIDGKEKTFPVFLLTAQLKN